MEYGPGTNFCGIDDVRQFSIFVYLKVKNPNIFTFCYLVRCHRWGKRTNAFVFIAISKNKSTRDQPGTKIIIQNIIYILNISAEKCNKQTCFVLKFYPDANNSVFLKCMEGFLFIFPAFSHI